MIRSPFLLAAALVALAGCSSVTVRRDYDPAADFSSLKTFAWLLHILELHVFKP